ncbi:hypothetical protein quinque_009009 [Culex quinquefasciatus]
MSLLPRSIAVQPPSAIANFRLIVPTEPLGVRTLRVQAGADTSVRRKPPDTRGIPRAVPSTAEHDRSRTRIARDTVPVLAIVVEAGGAEEGQVREQQLTARIVVAERREKTCPAPVDRVPEVGGGE